MLVARTQRSATSAFTRVFDALWLLRSGALQSRGRHTNYSSCAGLTRASIYLQKILAKMMDCRVKPGNDVWYGPGSAAA
jgi:hypothetical protein